MTKPQVSEAAAMETLKMLFPDTESGSTTPQQVMNSVGRDPKTERDRSWLRSRLSSIRGYNYVQKHYKRMDSGAKLLDRLSLTHVGKKALQQGVAPLTNQEDTSKKEIRFEQVSRDIEQLRDMLPEFNVVFEIKLRETPRS